MTEDYKKRLIEYVTGLLQPEQERPTDFDPEESWESDDDYNLGRYEDIIIALRGKYHSINGILQSNFNDVLIMYGAYQDNINENSKGFLIFFTNETGFYQPVKISLLNTRGIQFLKFDENSNRVYGVTGDRATYKGAGDNDCYFVYFNNLFLAYGDDVQPEQTYAYRIWNNGSQQFCCRDIAKQGEGSRYLIFGTQYTNLNYPTVIDLEIKVGESNVQTNYTTASNYLGYAFYGEFSGDTPNFKIIVYDNSSDVKTFKQALFNGTGITYGAVTISTDIKQPMNAYTHPSFVALSDDEIYFILVSYYNTPTTYTATRCTLYKYNGLNNTITEVYYEEKDHEYDTNEVILEVVNDQNTIYLIKNTTNGEYNYTHTEIANVTAHVIIQPTDWHNSGYVPLLDLYNLCNQRSAVVRQFNMLYFESFSGFFRENRGDPNEDVNGGQTMFTTIEQRIGYTGYPYIDYSCLVPRYAIVGIMSFPTFCRNVYNITKFENTTTASVEIPAQYCNFGLNNRQRLYGVTNFELIRNNGGLRKNIYEIVHLNFINTINVIDEDTDTYYPYSAVRVNYSTNTGGQTNYDACKCIKYRINYADNTSVTQTFNWTLINDYNKKTMFVIYADKDIDSIDFISNDQSAIYLHITGTFEQGKYYQIKQKVRVGEKPIEYDLLYNNQNVLYENKQVQIQGE